MADDQKGPVGPVGSAVATNLARIREAQRLKYVDIAKRLTDTGRPIAVLGLRRIEHGERRVDTDDLLALASVLGVHPIDLLVPPELEPDEPFRITPGETATAARARDWIGGRAFLVEPENETQLVDAMRHLPSRRAALLYHSWHVKRRSQADPGQRMLAQQLGLDEDPVDRLQELLAGREPNKEGRPGGSTEDIQGGEGKTGA